MQQGGSLIRYLKKDILFLLIIFLNSCSANKYFTENKTSFNFEGEWLLNNNPGLKLIILNADYNLYSLKYYSKFGDWEGVGYKINDKLLTIFKYKNINQNGYITFTIKGNDNIYFQSLNTNGDFRSSGNYYRKKSHNQM